MIVESPLHILESEAFRLVMGQAGVTKGDEPVNQGSIFTGQQSDSNKIAIHCGVGRDDLGRAELPRQTCGQLAAGTQVLPASADDKERAKKIRMDAIGDSLAVRPADADVQAVEYLQHLQQKILLVRIANSKKHTGLSSPVTLHFADIQKKPASGIATIKQPNQPGNT